MAEIVIGTSLPKTGRYAETQFLQYSYAYDLWARDVNAAGGMLGREVRLLWYDDLGEPEQVIAFAIENAPPIRTGLARFILSDDEAGTRLQATFDYEVRFGPLGPVIDRLIVHRQM